MGTYWLCRSKYYRKLCSASHSGLHQPVQKFKAKIPQKKIEKDDFTKVNPSSIDIGPF